MINKNNDKTWVNTMIKRTEICTHCSFGCITSSTNTTNSLRYIITFWIQIFIPNHEQIELPFFPLKIQESMFSLYQDLLPNIGDIMIEDDSILSNQIQKRQNCAV